MDTVETNAEQKAIVAAEEAKKDIVKAEHSVKTQVVASQNDFSTQIEALIPTAGTIELTEEQKEILYAPVQEEDVEIRPDGLIYSPWMEYVTRLRKAFGLKWAIIPHGMPKVNNNYVMWGFYLVIEGKIAGYAIGEQAYYQNNNTMTWGDACEGAKSNALMRLCKGIGISLELWKPSFIRTWKDKYAEQYMDKAKGKLLWRKKGSVQNGTEPVAQEPKKDYSALIKAEFQRIGKDDFQSILESCGFKTTKDLKTATDAEKLLTAIIKTCPLTETPKEMTNE